MTATCNFDFMSSISLANFGSTAFVVMIFLFSELDSISCASFECSLLTTSLSCFNSSSCASFNSSLKMSITGTRSESFDNLDS
ncbi:hypothetical protein SADUNF_Sadunf17G0000600 [Salix dunnii]|uniref:Uncharacterized protein n=1 Tax=Salix dunnii TaxID=1413687 RepID=A0A835J3Y8_9ROSI|nr:hypothetical protein SADUNF_Sadunf17G0000600 [Salix dunnii]